MQLFSNIFVALWGQALRQSLQQLPILQQIWFEERLYYPQLQAQKRALTSLCQAGWPCTPCYRHEPRSELVHGVVLAQALVNWVVRHSAA